MCSVASAGFLFDSGGVSAHTIAEPAFPFSPINELVGRGYTVFAVVHGSQPKFTIPEILDDMHRAVHYIRANASEFESDPERIGTSRPS